jgi:hypothetical protein
MSKLERPPISLVSDEAVDATYAYYATRPRSAWVTRGLAHPFGLLAYRTKSGFEGNSEEVIGDHFAEGGNVLLALEHVKKSDPFVIAGVAVRRRSLWPLVGNTNITAKSSLYLLPQPVPWFLDKADAQPAFQSHKDNSVFAPLASEVEIKARIHRAGDWVVKNSISILDSGGNVANFGRPGRRPEDDEYITPDKLRMGIGRIACGVEDRSKLLILPGAVDYERGLLRPSFAISYPFEVAGIATPELVVNAAATGMQKAREMAAEISSHRFHIAF